MKVLPGLLGLMLCLGCSEHDAATWEMDRGNPKFVRSIETETHSLTVRYMPRQALLLSRAGMNGNVPVSRGLLDSLEKAEPLPGGLTFLLTLSPRNPSAPGSMEDDVIFGTRNGFQSYKDALAAYQTGWLEKIWIETDGRKIPLASYQMENTFGMTPSRNFMMVFPDIASVGSQSIKLVLDGITLDMRREKLEFEIPMERYAKSK